MSQNNLSKTTDYDLSKLDRESILSGVDDVIQILYTTKDTKYVVTVLEAFEKFQDISGFARAKLLWGAHKWFIDTYHNVTDEDFYGRFQLKEKNGRTYADRLIRLWDAIENKKIPVRIYKHRKVRELLPISEALSQGYELTADTWKQLEQALDMDDVGRVIQAAKGKEPRKGALSLTVDSRGFITLWVNGVAKHAGTLNYADMETDPDIKKAILRIKKGGNIKDK